ncbi:lipopolysaccharide biosynthesis protein [Methylobacterium flocculans]|uniref:lipopolysaccharide biosynthesis protein n=1 Tax=Methylobacterium flocculans TaxID=2984843 RepID=UPI0021F2C7BE|nr:lipopolysaccharide biosynthesis protein [Methylobacterium sp. FF17]
MSTIQKRIFLGTILLSGARIFSNIVSLISTLILARLLLPADFGLVALAGTMLAIITALSGGSFSDAIVYYKAPDNEHYHTIWTLNALKALFVAFVSIAISWPLARYYQDIRLMYTIAALSIGTIIMGLENPKVVRMTKELVFWQQVAIQISQRIVSFLLSASIAYYYESYWALIIGTISGQICGIFVSYIIAPYIPKLSLKHFAEVLMFAGWLNLSQAINVLNWNFDNLLVGTFLGKGALGYYTVGNNLAIIPSREAVAPLTSTLYPAFSNLIDEPKRLAIAYQKAQGMVMAVALPVGVGVALIAEPLVILTMGEKWLPSVLLIQVLSSVFAIQTMGSLAQPLAMASGQTRLLFVRDLQSFIGRIPTIVIGMYLGGLPGVVYARALFGTASILLNMLIVRRIIDLSIFDQLKSNFRPLASALIMAFIVSITGKYLSNCSGTLELFVKIFIQVACGSAAYCAITSLLWLAMGKREGPEQQIINVVSSLMLRVFTNKSQ